MDTHRFCRFKRKAQVLSVMLSGFLCFTLYTLCFSCCSVANDGSPMQRDNTAFLGQGAYVEARSQRDVNQHRRHVHNRLARKTLLHQDPNNGLLSYDKPAYKDEDLQLNQQAKLSPNQNSIAFLNQEEMGKYVNFPHPSADYLDDTSSEFENSNKLDINDNSNNANTYHNNRDYRTHMSNIDKMGTRKLPQAIIIGVKKGGTRALLEFLRIHPDVRAPGPEPHFFDRHYHRGLEWYRRQMPTTLDGQITLEKTPSYFVTKGVPARIYNMSHDVKLLVVVRDPVTRAISDYTQTSSKRPDVKPFEQMAFLDNTTGLVDTSWGAIRIGVYAKHLERWLKYFPLSRIHFVNGERLISDPASEMAAVQSFLGLKNVITQKHFYFNTTKGFPCLKKGEGSSNPHCLGKTKGRQHPDIDPKVLQRLRDFFRPFNAKFYQMTGIDMGWPL